MADEDRKNHANAKENWRPDTLVTHAGLSPMDFHGFVNPPVVPLTVLFANANVMLRAGAPACRRPHQHADDLGLTSVDLMEGKSGRNGARAVGLAAVTVRVMVTSRAGRRSYPR